LCKTGEIVAVLDNLNANSVANLEAFAQLNTQPLARMKSILDELEMLYVTVFKKNLFLCFARMAMKTDDLARIAAEIDAANELLITSMMVVQLNNGEEVKVELKTLALSLNINVPQILSQLQIQGLILQRQEDRMRRHSYRMSEIRDMLRSIVVACNVPPVDEANAAMTFFQSYRTY